MEKTRGPDLPEPNERADVRLGVNRCPYCRDDVLADESVVCQSCLTRHHPECWHEGDGCSACRSTSLLERAPKEAPHEERTGRELTFTTTYKGIRVRARARRPITTELALHVGDVLVAQATRSIVTDLFHGFLTWFGIRPKWEISANARFGAKEHHVAAVHSTTFTRQFIEIYVDGVLIGPGS